MSVKTRELQRLWWDWLGTSERLLRSLNEQTLALMGRDVTRIESLHRIESLQPELETMMGRMRWIDDQAAACAAKLAEGMGVEPTLRGLTHVLPETEAQQLNTIANRVRTVASNVEEVLDRNRTLLENELTYVGGTLALIAKAVTEQQGRFGHQTAEPVLLDQVA